MTELLIWILWVILWAVVTFFVLKRIESTKIATSQNQAQEILKKAQDDKQKMISEAKSESNSLLDKARNEANELTKKAEKLDSTKSLIRLLSEYNPDFIL